MGDTKIEWTEKTWNPVRGCSVVSEGCRNCYAMTFAARFAKPGEPYDGLAYRNESGAHWTGKVRLIEEHLEDPLHWKRPARIFVNSMSDLFHESLTEIEIGQVFSVMAQCPQHTFQVLTKRPQIMLETLRTARDVFDFDEPLPNVWLGTSVEDQKTADERIPLLLQTPAAVRWISAEPLLGPIKARVWYCACGWKGSESTLLPSPSTSLVCPKCGGSGGLLYRNWLNSEEGSRAAIDWVVVGGESGPKARPMHPDWARSLRDQCVAAGVPFFFKQWGEWKEAGHDEDGPEIEEIEYPSELAAAYEPLIDGFLSANGDFVRKPKDFAPDVHYRALERPGKKAAGRLLDGCEWNEYPKEQARAAVTI